MKLAVAAGVVAYLAYWALNYAIWMDLFQRTYNHSPGSCRRLEGIEFGSEDIQVLPDGRAFISSGWRVKKTSAYNNRPGRIYMFNFNKPTVAPRELTVNTPDNIQLISPHGISLWTDKKTGIVYLYVISHQEFETVDKFQFDAKSKSLNHVRRITNDPNFHLINDLAVIGEDQFYYTNFFYFSDIVELTFGLRWGSLGYFDGTRSKLLDTGLYVPNGLILTPGDARFLYVAQLAEQDIRVYKRHDNNSLTFVNSIKVGTKVDNVDVDAKTGDLWVGAHPLMFKILQHLDNPALPSPSQILRLKMTVDGEAESIEEIYFNDGSELSASSVAVRYGRGLLIGSVATGALYCEIK
jgi:sugar lactone lactonase YvrE